MNKFFQYSIVILSIAFLFACEDDSSTPTNTVLNNGETAMTATIDGQPWVAFNSGIQAGLDSTGALSILAIGAAGSDSSLIILGTPAPQGGPFTIDTLDGGAGAALDLFFGAISGNIAITQHDANAQTVSGTFDFETGEFFGSPSRSVADGVFFNLKYTK